MNKLVDGLAIIGELNKTKKLGRVDLSWLNFVRDKSILIAARGKYPSHSKQIPLNNE